VGPSEESHGDFLDGVPLRGSAGGVPLVSSSGGASLEGVPCKGLLEEVSWKVFSLGAPLIWVTLEVVFSDGLLKGFLGCDPLEGEAWKGLMEGIPCSRALWVSLRGPLKVVT
jgi:hypothetical protein